MLPGDPVCPSCGAPVPAAFCGACGERRFASDELTLRAQLGQLLGGLFSVDGRLLRSFGMLLARPGFLAQEYCRGARVGWMRPVQLFLVANLVYFLLQPLTGFNTFNSTLALQVEHQVYSESLRPVVEARLAELGLARAEYAAAFDRAASGLARSLLILLVPALALVFVLFALVGLGGRRTFVEHLALASHYVSFQLTFVYVGVLGLVGFASVRFRWALGENAGMILILCLLAAWLTPAWRRFHGVPWWRALLAAALAGLAQYPLILAYRYLLFWLTFWSI